MKIQQHTNRPIFHKTKAALLTGALLLALLPGCAADTSAPVVTEDDLTPASAAQAALQQEAGSGKTYRYVWPAEDPAQAEEWARSQAEAWYREVLGDPTNADEEAQENARQTQQAVYESRLDSVKEESQLIPTVPAQEAANLAGRALEQVYGVDLSGEELMLTLTQIYHGSTSAQAGQPKGMIWTVTGQQQDNFSCVINAETGACEQIDYACDLAAAAQTPRASCSHALFEGGDYWVWDVHSPEFEPLIQSMMDEASTALSGSLLVGGAQVIGAEYTPRAGEEEDPDRLIFCFHCDNGQDCYLEGGRAKFYPEYDLDGCPLRGYIFYASDPFNVSD